MSTSRDHWVFSYMTKIISTVVCIILQRDILICAQHLDQLEQDFRVKMDTLKDTVQSKSAVPTSQVYVS